MQLIKDTHIDFMKYRKFWIWISLAMVAIGVISIFIPGWIRLGIDFEGGTQINVRFKQQPNVNEIRRLLEGAGLRDLTLQRFGEADRNEVLIKTPVVAGSEEGSREKITAALDQRYNQGVAGGPDLNAVGAEAIAELLAAVDPDGVAAQGPEAAAAHYAEVADQVVAERHRVGILADWNGLRTAEGVGSKVVAALEQRTHLGNYTILGVENVGPQIGKELRRQGLLAVGLSLLGMLTYIALRFELRFGIGAVMASLHDVLVTIGLFALFKFEFNLTTVAAFLTLVGYSVNDTVIIFDRIRENMRKNKRKPLIDTMNESINQTLSRTLMTSGLTLMTCLALLVFGGDVLRGFAFVMSVGIVIGTYSSIYIASPFTLLWEEFTAKRGAANGTKSAASAAR